MHTIDTVSVSGNPPVTAEHLRTCKRLLAEFAAEKGLPTPVEVEWTEHEGIIHFIGQHDGRIFSIGAPKLH